MTRTLIALAAFLCLAGTAVAAPRLSVQTARSVTSSKMNIEHLKLSDEGVPNTGTVDAACTRKARDRVVCGYTIKNLDPTLVCQRKVTVRSHTRAPATGKVRKYPCEAAS